MDSVSVVTIENHRSRERIRDMGEVFTPDHYVSVLMQLIDERVWSDETAIFFEPSVGQGNILVSVLEKRIDVLTKKFRKTGEDHPLLCAVANSLNTLWAIDICPQNVDDTRSRVAEVIGAKLRAGEPTAAPSEIRDFWSHAVCTIIWQIQENEALSALSDDGQAAIQAGQTRLGADWIATHKHQPLNFDLGWCQYFRKMEAQGSIPLLFRRAEQFINGSGGNQKATFADFAFARGAIPPVPGQTREKRVTQSRVAI